MDQAVTNAMARREALKLELAEIEQFLQLYERFTQRVGVPDSLPRSMAEQNEDISSPEADQPEASPRAPKLNRLQLIPHIREVILEAEKPLTRGVLLRKLTQRGIHIGGEYDRAKNMGTIMWRLREHFINLRGWGYWPRDLAFNRADYEPDSAIATDDMKPDLADLMS